MIRQKKAEIHNAKAIAADFPRFGFGASASSAIRIPVRKQIAASRSRIRRCDRRCGMSPVNEERIAFPIVSAADSKTALVWPSSKNWEALT